LIFSIKESFYKAAFASVGRYIDFDAVVIEEINVSEKTFRLAIVDDLSETLIKVFLIAVDFFTNGYVITKLTL